MKTMAKVWVLDTDTKGTGAQMVPLEKTLENPAEERRRIFANLRPEPRREEPGDRPDAEPPSRFRIVDVMTGRALAEDADTRAAVEALQGVRSVVDVSVYVWDERSERWRQLSHRERRLLWHLRDRLPAA